MSFFPSLISTKVWDATHVKHESVPGQLWGAEIKAGNKSMFLRVDFPSQEEAQKWADDLARAINVEGRMF